jgi:hypothetical protein
MQIEFDIVSGNSREIPSEKQPEIHQHFPGENIPENPFDILDEKADEKASVFIGGCLVIFALIFGHLMTLIIGFIAAIFATVAMWQVRNIQQQNKKYKFVASLKSPIFITSRWYGDNTVYRRRVIAEALIASAWPKSKYMPTPPVFDLYRGDEGESDIEWLERKNKIKVEKTKEYHAWIKSGNPGYYYRFILDQKDYPWQEEPQKG